MNTNMRTILIVFLLIFFDCSTGNRDKVRGAKTSFEERDYKALIETVIIKFSLDQYVSVEELQSAIPTTQEEFMIYYAYTYPDKDDEIHRAFYKVDSAIGKNAANNNGSFLRLYLELSSFVDGEYAESFYADVDFILEKNRITFCELYKVLTKSCKEKLEDYHLQYCK